MNHLPRLRLSVLLLLAVLLISVKLSADSLLMLRVKADFPSAMVDLQKAITDQGYTISRVQRVDIGLIKSGYRTERYRVVFFGKPAEIKRLSRKYPELIPYLPLKIVIFAEGEDTLIVASNPMNLDRFYQKRRLKTYFSRWSHDFQEIFDHIRKANE